MGTHIGKQKHNTTKNKPTYIKIFTKGEIITVEKIPTIGKYPKENKHTGAVKTCAEILLATEDESLWGKEKIIFCSKKQENNIIPNNAP